MTISIVRDKFQNVGHNFQDLWRWSEWFDLNRWGGDLVLIINYSSFAHHCTYSSRWSALSLISSTWCQKVQMMVSTPQKRWYFSRIRKHIDPLDFHAMAIVTTHVKMNGLLVFVQTGVRWALHRDGLELWWCDHRRRAHNCFFEKGSFLFYRV